MDREFEVIEVAFSVCFSVVIFEVFGLDAECLAYVEMPWGIRLCFCCGEPCCLPCC